MATTSSPRTVNKGEETSLSHEERLERARAILRRMRERAAADPTTSPFAAKMQEIEARRRSGLPLYNPDRLAEAMAIHDDLTPARKAANQTVLSDE